MIARLPGGQQRSQGFEAWIVTHQHQAFDIAMGFDDVNQMAWRCVIDALIGELLDRSGCGTHTFPCLLSPARWRDHLALRQRMSLQPRRRIIGLRHTTR